MYMTPEEREAVELIPLRQRCNACAGYGWYVPWGARERVTCPKCDGSGRPYPGTETSAERAAMQLERLQGAVRDYHALLAEE
jgi:hypothetical protein